MRKRRLFILKGNFQLRFLIGLTVLVVAGILAASVLNFFALGRILEEAAFSAHLSLTSSHELLWRAILQVSLMTAGAVVVVGCVVIACAVRYLEAFFRLLADGLRRLARGELSFRLETTGKWWGRYLLRDFNEAAASMEKRSTELEALLEACIAAAASGRQEVPGELRALNEELRKYS